MILSPSRYLALRRLHSLSGIFPLGAFLLWHLAVNSSAVLGETPYNRTAAMVERLPLVRLAEVLMVGVPLALHIAIGALLGNTEAALPGVPGQPVGRPHLSERLIRAQRASGGWLIAFVLFHVWSTRFSPDLAKFGGNRFAFLSSHLRDAAVLPFYALGVLAACIHFGVGVYDFAHQWGLAGTPSSSRGWARAAGVAAAALAVVGMATLAALR